MLRETRVGLLLLFALGIAVASKPASAEVYEDGELVLGRISDNPKQHYEQLKPLLDYVVPRMKDIGITHGRILMARDAQQMASYLRRGRVDWVTETAGTGVQLQQRAGAQPLLLTERDGVRDYRSLIFVRADSGIGSLQDLRGHSIAFQNATSTSAYLVPAAALLSAGLSPGILLSPEDKPDARTVGYVFARTEFNIASWVHKRIVDAGSISTLDWESRQSTPLAFRDDFRIIWQSDDIPRGLELVRGDLPEAVADRLREVLLQAADDPEAKAALEAFFRTTGFAVPDARSRRALQQLGDSVARVRGKIE